MDDAKKIRDKKINEYHKRAFTSYTMRFHNINDKDIIEAIEKSENKTNYIRMLIYNDIHSKRK